MFLILAESRTRPRCIETAHDHDRRNLDGRDFLVVACKLSHTWKLLGACALSRMYGVLCRV